MKKILKLGLVLLCLGVMVLVSSCTKYKEPPIPKPSNTKAIIKRDMPIFEEVRVANLDTKLSYGEKSQVIIHADTAFLPYLIIGVKDKVLFIRMEERMRHYTMPYLLVEVISPSFKSIQGYNGARISIDSLKEKESNIFLSDRSRFNSNVNCTELNINAMYYSTLNLEGKVNLLNIKISNLSFLDAERLIVNNLSAYINRGSGINNIVITSVLNASLFNKSSIKYCGNPTETNIHSFNSSIEKLSK